MPRRMASCGSAIPRIRPRRRPLSRRRCCRRFDLCRPGNRMASFLNSYHRRRKDTFLRFVGMPMRLERLHMTDAEYARKLDELDRLLNDPDIPMEPAKVWSLLAEI